MTRSSLHERLDLLTAKSTSTRVSEMDFSQNITRFSQENNKSFLKNFLIIDCLFIVVHIISGYLR
ncbi:MAG: hypothetical protein WA902_04575, partial [Thermosynechococcaceae cyanobacterium]